MSTLFDKIGGKPAIEATVDLFYAKVLNDDRIKHFFSNTDMDSQRKHQKAFLTFAFGGMPSYPGKGMRVAHADLVKNHGLSDVHFDAVVEDLVLTLKELAVSDDLIKEVVELVETTRRDILDR